MVRVRLVQRMFLMVEDAPKPAARALSAAKHDGQEFVGIFAAKICDTGHDDGTCLVCLTRPFMNRTYGHITPDTRGADRLRGKGGAFTMGEEFTFTKLTLYTDSFDVLNIK